jgi:hypothetical protein
VHDARCFGDRRTAENAAETAAPSEFILLLSKVNAAMRRRCAVAWHDKQTIGIRFLPL